MSDLFEKIFIHSCIYSNGWWYCFDVHRCHCMLCLWHFCSIFA